MNETSMPASKWILPDSASVIPSIYSFEIFEDLFDIKDHYLSYIITKEEKAIQLQLAKNTSSSKVMISSIEKSIDVYDFSIDFIVISDLRIDFEDFDIQSLNTGAGTSVDNEEFLVHANRIEELLCRLIDGESTFVAIEHPDTGTVLVLKSNHISIGEKLDHKRFDPMLSCFEDLAPELVAINLEDFYESASPTFCYAIPYVGHAFEISKTLDRALGFCSFEIRHKPLPSGGLNESSVS